MSKIVPFVDFVMMLGRRGVRAKVHRCIQGEGDQRLGCLLRTYLMDDPFLIS